MKRVCAVMLSTTMLLCGLVGQANANQDLNGSSPPSGLHGVREYFKSGKFRVPRNITGVLVVMWAGGGGAGQATPMATRASREAGAAEVLGLNMCLQ
jgi:hypothetical protein